MIGTLGWQQLLIILVILALLFGASRVQSLGGALGKGIREFRSEVRADDSASERSEEATTAAPRPAQPGADAAERRDGDPPRPTDPNL